jgi:hypothetical protein
LGAIKPKGLDTTAKIGYGYLCPREKNLSFDFKKLPYLGTVNFNTKYIL